MDNKRVHIRSLIVLVGGKSSEGLESVCVGVRLCDLSERGIGGAWDVRQDACGRGGCEGSGLGGTQFCVVEPKRCAVGETHSGVHIECGL